MATWGLCTYMLVEGKGLSNSTRYSPWHWDLKNAATNPRSLDHGAKMSDSNSSRGKIRGVLSLEFGSTSFSCRAIKASAHMAPPDMWEEADLPGHKS